MLEAAVAEVRGPAPTHPGSREQQSLRPPTKIPSGQHGLWGHNAASRPPPLPRRRVALPRTAWCGALSAGRSSGSRIMAVSGLPKRPASTKRAAQWHTVETDSPVTAARPRRSYTGLPLTHTSWAQYSTEASVSLLAVISQKSAPVGKLKSWRVEELKSPWTRCDLSNFPTFQLLRRLAHNNCERDAQRADRIHVAHGHHPDEHLPSGPLDPGDGGTVFIDVDLGRGRGGHNRKRRGQDASSRQQGRLIRQAQELAADDLPRLPAINDPFDEHGALRVDEPIIE